MKYKTALSKEEDKEMSEEKLDGKTASWLKKFSKKQYSQEEINKAEKTARKKYKDKLKGAWDKVRLLFLIARHPLAWGAQYAAMAVTAIIYLVSPIDAVPDFLPGGIVDDIAVITFTIGLLFKAVTSFTTEKKIELRKLVPQDLLDLYDSMTGLKTEESIMVVEEDSQPYTGNEKQVEKKSSSMDERPVTAGQANVFSILGSFIPKPVTDKFKEMASAFIVNKLDPGIQKEVELYLDRWHCKRLANSLFNLAIHILSVLLVRFPIFGPLASSLVSLFLFLFSIGFAVYRFVKFITNKHTIPAIKTVVKERNIKRGIAQYLRRLKGWLRVGERVIDSFIQFIGLPDNKHFLDQVVDHIWEIVKKSVIRFILVEVCIIVLFFIMRHFLLQSMTGITTWDIIIFPVTALKAALGR